MKVKVPPVIPVTLAVPPSQVGVRVNEASSVLEAIIVWFAVAEQVPLVV